MKYRNQEDTCPLCGERWHIDYDGMEFQDEFLSYNCFCRSCGASWTSWYSLVYNENTDVMDKDGNEIE